MNIVFIFHFSFFLILYPPKLFLPLKKFWTLYPDRFREQLNLISSKISCINSMSTNTLNLHELDFNLLKTIFESVQQKISDFYHLLFNEIYHPSSNYSSLESHSRKRKLPFIYPYKQQLKKLDHYHYRIGCISSVFVWIWKYCLGILKCLLYLTSCHHYCQFLKITSSHPIPFPLK